MNRHSLPLSPFRRLHVYIYYCLSCLTFLGFILYKFDSAHFSWISRWSTRLIYCVIAFPRHSLIRLVVYKDRFSFLHWCVGMRCHSPLVEAVIGCQALNVNTNQSSAYCFTITPGSLLLTACAFPLCAVWIEIKLYIYSCDMSECFACAQFCYYRNAAFTFTSLSSLILFAAHLVSSDIT